MSKVLILGAGRVAKPLVNYLLDKKIHVTLADIVKSKAEEILARHPYGQAVALNVEEEEKLENLILHNDLIVSILPFMYHVKIAKLCIKHKKHMLTTSYISPEMKALHDDAVEAGILILNELGLDPGIDHMSAKKIIDEIHSRQGIIEEFYSFCGALPAEIKTPFGYRFSWSPRGVIKASKNSAKYLKNGKIIEVASEDIFKDIRKIDLPHIGSFEVYPNRDSVSYIDLYDIPEAKTVLRGTIRHIGWCEILNIMRTLKLFSFDTINVKDKTYADFITSRINEKSSDNIIEKFRRYFNLEKNSIVIKAFDWLGLFSNEPIENTKASPFEILSDLMMEKLKFGENEKDMVVLLHQLKVKFPDGKEEIIRSTMVDYGTLETVTAIARTVALPAAIGVKMILNKEIDLHGVHIPNLPFIYNPILDELELLNIKMEEEYGLTNNIITE